MSDQAIRCPWDNCHHRIDDDGFTVHMRRGVNYDHDRGTYVGGKWGSIIAVIEVKDSR